MLKTPNHGFFLCTITSYRFFSGSKLPSTHFQKISGFRQLQIVEGSQLASTPFHKIPKMRQLIIAPGSWPPSSLILKLLMKLQLQIASCFRQLSVNNYRFGGYTPIILGRYIGYTPVLQVYIQDIHLFYRGISNIYTCEQFVIYRKKVKICDKLVLVL